MASSTDYKLYKPTLLLTIEENAFAVLIGSVTFLVIYGAVTRSLADLVVVACLGLAAMLCGVIGDEIVFKIQNAKETMIWQAWAGYVLDYLAVAGWVGFVKSNHVWSGCVGLGVMAGCSLLALYWFHRPYRYALLSVCPEDLDRYNRLRYGRRLDKAAAKGKRKRVLSLFSRFIVYKCINNNFDLGTDFSSPADDALRTLDQLRLARLSFRYWFDRDYKVALNSEIQNFGKMLDKLADNMLAKYSASAVKEGN